ncbi:hypothetical protein ABB37_09835 [Leptomonas pyrrhocoris]|uniref:SET domain-containing protein n=1 Tax=Leptomonas pyrrhocoris TaxID=157538 RepID=A0A0M9FPU5_LEPPY|nr:hypothetical protein ABB37_09835 [Leptomonas pyrrhocoris]KPA73523.1 hypothetical protein ABB37_09835 [Leptomonas pyrrhocoris]|eukprot:XP_015651962.1 hypothetical protein ABB37_09835 [Leptomonas pyrrhocoris]
MSASGVDMDVFWEACTAHGVVSKKLVVHRSPHSTSPVGLCAAEAVKHGAPLINVPYHAVLNAQTLRGDLLPRALPPLRKAALFLTRRGRLGLVTAHSLWLACFLACHAEECAHAQHARKSFLHPFLSNGVYPPLPNLFLTANASSCPGLRSVPAAELQEAERRVSGEMDLIHTMLRHYGKRRGVPAGLCPHREALVLSYRTVMQRAILLPLNCQPSSPDDLAELIESSPGIPLIPSLVPVIDMIRPAHPSKTAAEAKEDDESEAELTSSANCTLLTCVQSDFVSPSSRRRVIVETAPLAARRVVVCAAKAIKEGEELRMDFE